MTQPTIGRIVHYQSYGTRGGQYLPEPRAAVVTALCDVTEGEAGPCVSLCVLNPTGMFFAPHVEFSAEPQPGRWSWPPRV